MNIDGLLLQAEARGVRLPVLIQPGASRDAVLGIHDGQLKMRISAPPVEGAANERCLKFLAKEVLGVSRAQLTLLSGERSKRKVFLVEGLTVDDVRGRLSAVEGVA
jgi:uncharacterized protein (TIGR00251 family)